MTDVEAVKHTSHLSVHGEPLYFRNLSVSVPIPSKGLGGLIGRTTGEFKDILDGICGAARPGELLYLMGPSGSGKTSLLDALADRMAFEVKGAQMLGSEPKTASKLKKVAKYVQQNDELYGVLTVRETLDYACQFYCTDKAEREELVEETIDALGLRDQVDTKIGNVFFRGLSGGQRRRVSVGEVLVARPSIIFLDEPTSGLDSTAALKLMQLLRGLTRTANTSVVCVIHQPGHEVFEQADSLLLLSGGKQVYYGPREQLVDHFGSLGFELPARLSVAEWAIDLINADFSKSESVEQCKVGWLKSAQCAQLTAELDENKVPLESAAEKAGFIRDGNVEHATSFFSQLYTLSSRGLINMLRDPATIWLRMAMYVALAVLMGTVWLRLPQDADQVQNIAGMLFFCSAFCVFMSIAVLPSYIHEQGVFMKERSNGAYAVSPFVWSHFVCETPYVFFMSVIISGIVYPLVGLRGGAEAYFTFLGALFFALAVAEAMMFLVSAVCPIFVVGIAVSAFTYGLFMIVQNFFVQIQDVGWWWRWAQYISLHFFAFNIFFQNQFAPGEVYKAVPPQFPNDMTGADIQAFYGFGDISIGVSFIVLTVMVFVYRFIAIFFLWAFFRGKK